ncbi:hypothetical protein R4B61_06490 [Fructilactobacillus vespulae]|uniref:hypothetical protein n=1 Tax=Fructilactobacillus vespulae TaxID=1249630 RepID=UPI0039B5A38D
MKKQMLFLKISFIAVFLGTGTLRFLNKVIPQINVWYPRFAGMLVTFVVALLLIKYFKFNEQ